MTYNHYRNEAIGKAWGVALASGRNVAGLPKYSAARDLKSK